MNGEDDFARYHMQQKAKQQSNGDKMKTFNWYYDDAHEWLEVDLDYLMIRGLANKVSSFSFYSKPDNKAYLEGDCDAGILYKAMGDAWNNDGALHIDCGSSNYNPIRNQKRFPIQ